MCNVIYCDLMCNVITFFARPLVHPSINWKMFDFLEVMIKKKKKGRFSFISLWYSQEMFQLIILFVPFFKLNKKPKKNLFTFFAQPLVHLSINWKILNFLGVMLKEKGRFSFISLWYSQEMFQLIDRRTKRCAKNVK